METEPQTLVRRTKNTAHTSQARAMETEPQTDVRRTKDAAHTSQARAMETEPQTLVRRTKNTAHTSQARAMETEPQTLVRRTKNTAHTSQARAMETEPQTLVRRTKNTAHTSQARAMETEPQTLVRRTKNTAHTSQARAMEAEPQTLVRKNANKQSTSRKRSNETQQEIVERKTKNRRTMSTIRHCTKTIDVVIDKFLTKVRTGPDFVCTSCHRMLYRHTVVRFKPCKYTKADPDLLEKLSKHAHFSKIDGNQWVCKTCDGSITRGVMPAQATINGMELDSEPHELKCLNALERRLIALRVPFMKMVALPTGKQKCIHGPAVNVPSKVDTVCDILPRLPSECQLVPLKLKRKLSYKGHYLYDYVSPERLSNALIWLKANNSLYAHINICDDWVTNAIADDQELVMSMLEQDEPMHDSHTNEPEPTKLDANSSIALDVPTTSADISHTASSGDSISVHSQLLGQFVGEHGLVIHDVPGDGNCMFSSVSYQLQHLGHDVNASTLREMSVDYLTDNGDRYSHFVHQSVDSNDGYNADNEPLDEEDSHIASLADPEEQRLLRWGKYLRRLSDGAWGDHIALTAIANLFSLKINTFTLNRSGTNVVTVNPCGEHEVNIGLIMQYHFVGLDAPVTTPTLTNSSLACASIRHDSEVDHMTDPLW
ncbi:uncharacterized protein LOC135348074 [Halichondria panicea]|uniref:uncharacterized protein LOC135348074 n=1 Tax=Halichondria panicea TaxID=6063 RepID=UPI00312B9211